MYIVFLFKNGVIFSSFLCKFGNICEEKTKLVEKLVEKA